jgi:histidyl-tRNA synthetase
LGSAAAEAAFRLLHDLRCRGLGAMMDHEGRSLKSQMKQAGRLNARYVLILGEEELKNDLLVVREMATGEQTTLPLPADPAAWAEALADKLSR